jgi:2,4-didehydro-3-deoxy-L-rhamnonate hydrolase
MAREAPLRSTSNAAARAASGVFTSLQPGNIISTGTPPGVGMGLQPPAYLKAGNRMRLGIEGLGEQHQRVVAETD